MSEEKYPALILAGGLGTRLRSISTDLPKPMVVVLSRPFLFWLFVALMKGGFRDFILSTGYRAKVVEDYDWGGKFPASRFEFVRENEPLGTGGAVKAVFDQRPGLKAAWVINGDTLLTNPLPPQAPAPQGAPGALMEGFYSALEESEIFDAKPNLVVSPTHVLDVNTENGRYFDGGQLFITREAIDRYKGPVPCSIHELLKPSIEVQRVTYKVLEGTCYDIGTPERLGRFKTFLEKSLTSL